MDLGSLGVSFYDNVKASKRCDLPVARVLEGIRKCTYKEKVAIARRCLNNGDKQGYDTYKSQLPAVAFCGTFDKGHKADDCNHYNSLLVIDIDKLTDMELEKTYHSLKDDPYVAAFWLSPSGNGYKGLVQLDYSSDFAEYGIKEKHKVAFRQFFVHLLSEYGIELDRSGSDISRLCYMSADSNLHIKDNAEVFRVEPLEKTTSKEAQQDGKKTRVALIKPVQNNNWNEICGKATGYKENKTNRNLLLYIYKKLKKRQCSITDTWENWVRVAFAIASSIHPEKGREMFLELCRLDGVNHDENKSDQLIRNAYARNQGKCSISTIIYLAKQKGVVLDR